MKRRNAFYSYFFIPYSLFFILLFSLILYYPKGELHLLLNSYHSAPLDYFFRYFTEFGASIPFIIAGCFILHKISSSLYMLTTLLLNALMTNSLKLLFGVPRPSSYFSDHFPDIALQYVDGMRIYTVNGFPSGHTSAAFAIMLCVTLILKDRTAAVICCILAILTGYSRVYLSQHFAEDILLGSVVGVTVALALYPIYKNTLQKHYLINHSITSLF